MSGRVGIMITNGGTHAPAKWAAESAAQIVDVIVIEPDSIVRDTMVREKDVLAANIETALIPFHKFVQDDENEKLDEVGETRLNESNQPDMEHLDQAVEAVQAVADKTIFGPHFRKPEVRPFIVQTLGSHFTTVRHSERSWYADKHPDSEQTKIFRARTGGTN